jgi:uncharacterized protein
MSLVQKVRKVEQVFSKLEKETLRFKNETGLFCKAGCGACCRKPDIEATPLEFLPLAYHLFKEQKSIEFLERLEQSNDGMCVNYNPLNPIGSCSAYLHRGLICRLFGYAAFLNKYGERQISTCKIIKEEQAENYQKAVEEVKTGRLSIPVMRDYYLQLKNIDPELTDKHLPINEAIRKAIEHVEFYYMYRRHRRAG